MEFCKAFNAATANMEQGTPTPVTITVYADRPLLLSQRPHLLAIFLKNGGDRRVNRPGRDVKRW